MSIKTNLKIAALRAQIAAIEAADKTKAAAKAAAADPRVREATYFGAVGAVVATTATIAVAVTEKAIGAVLNS